MLDLTKVLASIEKSSGLPNAFYVDAAMFQNEKDTLFRDNWADIGFGKDISEPGIVKPITFLGIPMIMARNWDGEINVFQNVCRHRGIILVEKSQRLRGPITCPYHAWAYDLNGNLRKTPNIGGPNINTLDPSNIATFHSSACVRMFGMTRSSSILVRLHRRLSYVQRS